MVERERTEAGEHKLCLSIYLVDKCTKWNGADRPLRFQGIDFQHVHLVDGLSSGLGLGAGGILNVEKTIASAIGSCNEALGDGGSVILVLDGLDFLLAATGCEMLQLLNMIRELREVRLPSICSIQHALAYWVFREIASPLHHHCHSCRSSPCSIAHYASRNIPHGFLGELSTSGEIDNEREGIRYRRCKGCQWSSED